MKTAAMIKTIKQFTLALMFLLGGLLSLPASAAIVVSNTNDSGAGSLRQAVIDANGATGADTVTFDASLIGSTILLTTGEIYITDNVTIQGLGAANLTIDGNRLGGGIRNIFKISVGVAAIIDGLTLQNGHSTTGACAVTCPVASASGGAITNDGTLTISNSVLTGNMSSGVFNVRINPGGAITNTGTLTITNSTLSNNTATTDPGGAIANYGALTIQNSILTGNTTPGASSALSGGYGGAIYSANTDTLSITNSTISNNTTNVGAGAIQNGGPFTLTNSTVSGNTTTNGDGGGISSSGSSSVVTITNSTVSGNSAPTGKGGGIINSGTVTLLNSTVTNNSASAGGGIYNLFNIGNTVNLGNTLVAGNSATTGPEIVVDAGTTLTSQGHNLLGVNGVPGISGTYTAGTGDLTPTVAITAIIGGLGNNGGSTLTHLPVAGSSPATNAGDDALIPVGITTDQRGYSRIQGTPLTVDIGAVESGSNYPMTVILAGTGSGSVSDGVLFNCPGACTTSFASAATVVLTANPDVGSTFTGWSGGGCSGTGTCTVTMSSAQSVTAVFDLAGNYTVFNTNDIGLGSLRQAIASGASTIAFDSALSGQTITLSSEIGISSNVAINGLGAANLAVSGGGISRIFNVTAGNVTLNGLTLRNGKAPVGERGGAILNAGALTISQSVLDGNQAPLSGGAIRSSGTLTIRDTTLSNNIANDGGGGAVVNVGTATIQNCAVSGNQSKTAGSAADGGAFYNAGTGTMNVIASTVSGNTSVHGGGGIANSSTSLTAVTVRDSTLSGNTANTGGSGHGGGGVFNLSGTVQVINSTLSGNQASSNVGGGIENYGTLAVTSSTMAYNSAATNGGGIYIGGGTLTIGNSLIAGNTASVLGPEIRVAGGTFASQGHNLFGVNGVNGLSGATPSGDLVPAVGVFIGNMINGLLPNGGPTQTHLPLPGLPGSTAIDAGDDLLATAAGLTTDQRGTGFPRTVNGTVDIGAVESAILPTFTATASVIGANGTINPATRIVSAGATTTFTVTPNPGYVATVGGTCGGSLLGTTYTTNAITAACTVEATFNLAPPLVVKNLNDTGAESLREVIALANGTAGPNTIAFDVGLTGTIPLTTGEIAITDDTTINGPGAITVSGGGLSRIFTIAAGKTVVIDGLTLSNGLSADPGGAILNNGNLTLSNNVFTSNQSTTTSGFSGGGAIQNFGTLTVSDSSFSSNTAVRGGAINIEFGGTATLSNSTLTSNTATASSNGGGGGIFSRGALTVDSCTLSSNTAPNDKGGGLYTWDGTANLFNSTIASNTAKYGAGLRNETASLTVLNSTVSGNTASGDVISNGGGLGNYTGTITITNSTISGNSATHTGGGIDGAFGPVTVTSSTVTGNSASYGGGIYTENALTVGNSLVAGNSASVLGPEIRVAGSGTLNSQGHNLLGINGVSGLSGATPIGTDLVPDVGTLIGNIIGGLANNGGPTFTHLPVAGSSPAINTGDNGLLAGLTTDQRGAGFLRIQPTVGTVDIGAVEDPTGTVNLTVIKAGTGDGAVSSTPAGLIDCGVICIASFNNADTVTLTATPDVDSSFTGWSGGGCSGIGICIVTMSQARTVTATFGALVAFVVKNLNDSGPDSLRQAVTSANSTPGADTIGFQTGLTGTITLSSGLIALSDDATLQGPGANAITVSGGGTSRIFTIASGKTVTLSGLTLSNGFAANDGGAIVNDGNLTISDSTVAGNTAGWGGGGIANASSTSTLTIRNSTLSGNTANSGSSGHGGGGVFNYLGSVTVINSTVSGNSVPTNTGGGLDNYGSMTVTSSTITGNSASYGGGIYTENALTVGNSLVAGNSASVLGPEIRIGNGIFTSQGYNLFGVNGVAGLSGTGAIPAATDIVPQADLLIGNIIGGLANNGGPTLTHLPVTDSLVINTGNDSLTPGIITADQRGAARRIGSTVDIGAVEDLNGANVHLLKVTRSGTGSGTVTDGSRINCGLACLANFSGNPSVTLMASPAPDSTFTGWSGGCSGTGTSCVVSMTTAQNVTATFTIGTSFIVTNLNDSGPGSLRQVIASANAVSGANPITFETGLTGTITLITGEIAITDDATIDGPDATNLTISGNNASRIFTVASGKTVSITKLTLANGLSANPGGAILNNGNLTISDSALSNNQSTLTGSFNGGGAIANTDSATLTVIDSSLSGNTGVVGGAINNQIGGTTTVRNSTLSGNTSTGDGGGIFSRGTLTIETSTVSGNSSTRDGGGIHAWDGTLTVVESTVASNTAAAGGGGIAGGTATLIVRNSTLSSNTANSGNSGHGGGGLFNLGGTVQVINSTVSGNRSPTNTGGGLDNYSSMTMINSTITGNSASYGGGIYSQNPLTVGNSLIAGNSASVLGPEIRIEGSSFTSQGHNLFGVNGVSGLSGASAIPNASDTTPQAGVFINTLIDALNNNGGGRTETHLLKAVCLPSSESCIEPAINAGSNALIPAGVTTDQRGAGFPRILNDIVDIGAVEDASGIVIKHLLTVTKAGTGSGAVNSGAADITCGSDCTESYPTNAKVTLTATPTSDSRFLGWTGDCVGANPTCTVTISRAKKVTATFDPLRHTLAVAQIGVGHGVIASTPLGIACGSDCLESYAPGTTVTLTAVADADSSFGGWSGACAGVQSCTIVLNNTQVVAATFNLISHTLIVGKAGTGVGTIASSPPGIECGLDCGEVYAQNTVVTLTATATNGSTFTGWSGACGGIAPCQVTMTAAHSVTATFNPATAPQ